MEDVRKKSIAALHVARKETLTTARVCAGQARRLWDFGRVLYDTRRLTRKLQLATPAFGERLYAEGLGDTSLRQQLEDLVQRRLSVEAARGSTRLLDAERRGLFIRLAEPYIGAAPPPGLSGEWNEVNGLRAELAALQRLRAERRSGLFPTERGSRLRLAAGCAAIVLVLCGGLWLISGDNEPGSQLAQPLPTPVSHGEEPGIQPVPPPSSVDSSKPVVKEHWADEDAYFPRRRVVVPYVNDVVQGECKCFDESGRLISVEHYRDGVLHGMRTSYYPSGKKFGELAFENGKAVQAGTVWFENGQVADVTEFDNGILHGKSIAYFPNGNKFLESQNVNGAAHGERLHYLPDGVCFGTSQWENGRKIGQRVVIDVSQTQYQAIELRSQFSLLLKDHWRLATTDP